MSVLFLRPVAPPFCCLDFPLENGVSIIGRSEDCDFVVNHPSVSRRHAKVVVANGRARVTDLGSRNGTSLDQKPVRKNATMAAGQQLLLGETIFAVLLWNPPEHQESQSEDETPSYVSDQPESGPPDLSAAERRVMEKILKGLSEKEIASALHLSRHTVHRHVQAIHGYFKVHSGRELLAHFLPK
jgi:DNA-binding NarL/FixJ family response regulator